MQVVLLAAGLGSRLGSLTERLPKALIQVAGETLLARAVRFAQLLRPTEIVVVGGFGFAEVAGEISSRGLPVRLLENKTFRDGNLVSLVTARPHITGDFLLMNVDHIYRPAVAERVVAEVQSVTAFVDNDRSLGPDDMKVARDQQGRVREIAKTLTEFDCGYVGMTRVPARDLSRYWATADAVIETEGRAVHVERILARLAASVDGEQRPTCRDISGIGWLEVDLSEERDLAEGVVRAAPDAWR
ncbi:MAG: NTP transferase domain-containing protein [Deltaproteobacteria bacterium]|nr:NTP transferase domain-containing protein [Deltaproteobacteria bacterium]